MRASLLYLTLPRLPAISTGNTSESSTIIRAETIPANEPSIEIFTTKNSILDINLIYIEMGHEPAINKINDFITLLEKEVDSTNFKGVSEDDQNTLVQFKRMIQKANVIDVDLKKRLDGYQARILHLQNIIAQKEKSEIRLISFDELFNGLSSNQLDAIGKNLSIVQLTTGCSVGCPHCSVSALKGARRHISWDALNEIIGRWGEHIAEKEISFYHSSDPLDWEDPGKGKNYFDVLQLIDRKLKYDPTTTTAIPKGKEELAKQIWESKYEVRISPSNINYTRLTNLGFWSGETIKELRASLSNPGNSDSKLIGEKDDINAERDLTYQAGNSYDFVSYIPSPTVTCGVIVSPDGAFNTAVTAITPLTPNGYVRLPIEEGSSVFLRDNYSPHARRNDFDLLAIEDISNPNNTGISLDHQYFQILHEVITRSIFDAKLVDQNSSPSKDLYLFHPSPFKSKFLSSDLDLFTTVTSAMMYEFTINLSISIWNNSLDDETSCFEIESPFNEKQFLASDDENEEAIDENQLLASDDENEEAIDESGRDFNYLLVNIDVLSEDLIDLEYRVKEAKITESKRLELLEDLNELKADLKDQSKLIVESLYPEGENGFKEGCFIIVGAIRDYLQKNPGHRQVLLGTIGSFIHSRQLNPRPEFKVTDEVTIHTILRSSQLLFENDELKDDKEELTLRALIHLALLNPDSNLFTSPETIFELPTLKNIQQELKNTATTQ
jgi:hypothetical protein